MHPPVERADRGQPLIAGRHAVSPADFEPVQEPCDGGGVDPVEGEPFGWDGPVVAEVGDQQFERVAVGRDRVGRASSSPARWPVRNRRRKTAKSVAMAWPYQGGRHVVADHLLDAVVMSG